MRALATVLAAAVLFVLIGCGEDASEVSTAPTALAQVYLAPDGSDLDTCVRSAPCQTLDRAEEVAEPGDIVELAAGRYPEQGLSPTPDRDPSGAPVVFQPAPGADVSFEGRLTIGSTGVELRDVDAIWSLGATARAVTLRNVRARGSTFITGGRDLQVIGGEIGPVDASDALQIKRDEAVGDPRNVLIDGVAIHDVTRRADPAHHSDCVQVGGVSGLVIRNSRIWNCATQGVFLSTFGGGRITDVVVENNWFGAVPEGYYSLIVEQAQGVEIRYNSFLVSPSLRTVRGPDEAPTGLTDVRMIGNLGDLRQHLCAPADVVAYSHNVWSDAACGDTDISAPPGFRDAETFDLRLAPGSAAIGHGAPDDFPERDIMGTRRPQGDGPDAGAVEFTD